MSLRNAKLASLALIPLALSLTACEGSEVGQNESNATEWANREARNEALTTKYVKKAICENIYGVSARAEACETSHEFTIIESRVSTKYGYLKAIEDDQQKAEIEVGRIVAVAAPNGGATYTAELLRQLDRDYHLRWTVAETRVESGGVIDPNAARDHIEDVAFELGEYLDFDESSDAERVPQSALPAAVILSCEANMLARAEMNSEFSGQCSGSADYNSDHFGTIKLNGEIVGYTCGVHDLLDNCSLWDGSGVWYALDIDGEVLVDTEWSG